MSKLTKYGKDSINPVNRIDNLFVKTKTRIDANAQNIAQNTANISNNTTKLAELETQIENVGGLPAAQGEGYTLTSQSDGAPQWGQMNTAGNPITLEHFNDNLPEPVSPLPTATGKGFSLVSNPDGTPSWAQMNNDDTPMTVEYFNQHAFKNNRRGIIEFGVGIPNNTELTNTYISDEINKYCTATGVTVSTNDRCILFVEDGVTLTIMGNASTMGHIFVYDGTSWQWVNSFENVFNNPSITLGDFLSVLNFASRWDGTDITVKTEGTLTVTINPTSQNQFLYEQVDTQGGAAVETDNVTLTQNNEGKLQVIDYVSKTYVDSKPAPVGKTADGTTIADNSNVLSVKDYVSKTYSDSNFATKTELNNIVQFRTYAAADEASALAYSAANPNVLVYTIEA